MKKLMIVAIICLIGYIAFTKKSQSQSQMSAISIKTIKEHSGVYADSLIKLNNLKVLESKVIMNYCSITVTDKSKERLIVLTHKPYNVGENISNLNGRYFVVFKNENEKFDIFVTEDLKPINDLAKVLKQVVIN